MTNKLQIRIAGKSFAFTIGGLTGYVMIVTILCGLGGWQVQRAGEQTRYMKRQAEKNTAPVDLNRFIRPDRQALEYQQVRVTGRYDDRHQFLIDNQVRDGKAGYFVMTPFFIANRNDAVLINRGWVPLQRDRSVKPEIGITQLKTTISGRVNHFPGVGLKLSGADRPTDAWPAVVQIVNINILEKILGYSLLDFQIEMNPAMPEGYRRDWQTAQFMTPQRHIAYAFQWFALAATFTVLYFWFSFQRND